MNTFMRSSYEILYSQVKSLVKEREKCSPLSLCSVLWRVTEPGKSTFSKAPQNELLTLRYSKAHEKNLGETTLSWAQVEGRCTGRLGSVCLLCGSRFPSRNELTVHILI